MSERVKDAMRLTAALASLYALAGVVGFGLLVLAFKTGMMERVDILFYRGLILIGVSFLVTFGLFAIALRRLPALRLGARDAFAAAVLSLSLNLGFLIVVPVTVDRSISIFVLGQMAAHPNEAYTADEMSVLFAKVYVGDDRQIARRLREQAISGTLEQDGDGYRISARGRLVIATARIVAKLFDSHAGILAPEAPVDAAPLKKTAVMKPIGVAAGLRVSAQ